MNKVDNANYAGYNGSVKFNSNDLLKLSLEKNQLWYDMREMGGDIDLKQYLLLNQ